MFSSGWTGTYAVLGAVYSGIPGALVGKLLFSGEGSWPYLSFCVALSWFVLFPVTFVSMRTRPACSRWCPGRRLSQLLSARLAERGSSSTRLPGSCARRLGVLVSAFAESSIAPFFFAGMTTLLGAIYFRLLGWTVGQLGDVLSPEVEELEEKRSEPPAGSPPVASWGFTAARREPAERAIARPSRRVTSSARSPETPPTPSCSDRPARPGVR